MYFSTHSKDASPEWHEVKRFSQEMNPFLDNFLTADHADENG
jgi:hypothetical protein